jgi:hypothetical protein
MNYKSRPQLLSVKVFCFELLLLYFTRMTVLSISCLQDSLDRIALLWWVSEKTGSAYRSDVELLLRQAASCSRRLPETRENEVLLTCS